jgi:hypothetical protein
MKTRSKVATILVASALAAGLVQPASALLTGATPVSVSLTGGVLGITVPTAAVPLGSHANEVGGSLISGALGTVQVNDARSAVAGSGWVTSVIATALTPTAGGPTIGATYIGYTVGTITQVGTATYTANNPPDLTGVSAAVTATGITGDNSATWNPMINVAVPGGLAAGSYTGTITHSLV